jgi:hypothetical protein
MIGTPDFPSMPWVKTGSLKIDTGRLSGVGAAATSQGVAIPYADARVRFRARFTGSDQKVTIAFDAASNGSAGVRITVDSAGSLSLTEGTVLIGSKDFAPLETGVDWFIEAIFGETGAEISLARANYGTEKQAKIEATLSTASLHAQASGKTAAVELASPSGVVPAIDELFVATCGSPAPGYKPKFIDTFERANSSTLGKAELPADLAWSSSSTNIKIVDGALQTAGELEVATIPLQLSLTGLRIRTTVKVVLVTSGPSGLWADVNVNVTQTSNGMPAQGFWFWGESNYFYTGIFTGGGELKHDVALSRPEKYYVQMDRDANVAVVTVREQSFEGPILGAQFAGGLLPNAEPGGFFSLGDEGGAGVRFEDVRADNYSVSFLLRQGFGPRRARLLYNFQNYSTSLGFFPDTFVGHVSNDNAWLHKQESRESRRATLTKVFDKAFNRDSDISHAVALKAASERPDDVSGFANAIRIDRVKPFYDLLFELGDVIYAHPNPPTS